METENLQKHKTKQHTAPQRICLCRPKSIRIESPVKERLISCKQRTSFTACVYVCVCFLRKFILHMMHKESSHTSVRLPRHFGRVSFTIYTDEGKGVGLEWELTYWSMYRPQTLCTICVWWVMQNGSHKHSAVRPSPSAD